MKSLWIEYSSNNVSGDKVRKELSEIELEFADSEPKIERGIFILPQTGKICPVSKSEFMLLYTEPVEKEHLYLAYGGEPNDGQESLSPSVLQHPNDDPFSRGRKRTASPGYSYRTAFFHGQKKNGTLFLEKSDDILSEKDPKSSNGMGRTSIVFGVLISMIAVFVVAGLIVFLPARDPIARSYALTLILFPVGLAVGAWFFFIAVPGVVAFVLVRLFSVNEAEAPRLARFILLILFLLSVLIGIIPELISR